MTFRTKPEISSIRTVGAMLSGRACSDTLFHVLNRALGDPLKGEEQATMSLAGGIMQHGYQCGMIWGATLAAGAQAYRLFGPGPQTEAMTVLAAERLVVSFQACNHHVNCFELTHIDKSSSTMQLILHFLIKGGSISCFHMAARYAPVALGEINRTFHDYPSNAPGFPVSCAALLARKMGLSDMHTVMAAGLAGGIGLCGGACGALGAAIWIANMNCNKEDGDRIKLTNPGAMDAIDRFMKCTDYDFECASIVGRRFESIEDHAGYLRDGGCFQIIEALANGQDH